MGAQRLLGVRCHDDARHGIAAVDAVALDQLAQHRGALLGGVDQPLAGGGGGSHRAGSKALRAAGIKGLSFLVRERNAIVRGDGAGGSYEAAPRGNPGG
jgi:hypothetical protein